LETASANRMLPCQLPPGTRLANPMKTRFLLQLLGLALQSAVLAQGPGQASAFAGRRVLYIGIDGCRADALTAAMERGLAPQMKALRESADGLLTLQCYAGGELGTPTQQPTVSGPGWTSLLTGVWMDQHGVKDNRFIGGRFQTCAHFMRRIKEVQPTAFCASFADWPPIHDFIADGSRVEGREFLDVKFTRAPDAKRHFIDNPEKDIEVRDAALKTLREQDPDVLFVYFGSVDEFGHGAIDARASFSPDSTLYLNAISHVDSHVGELVRAMRARPQFAGEDWLVLITTDHGGRGNSHGGDSDVERNIWLLAHGAHLPRERLLEAPVPQTALVPMIYAHLGITPKPEWTPKPAQPPPGSPPGP
jgi:predicted AlkP superfamily pyrophosphatase or phosphodiesterase